MLTGYMPVTRVERLGEQTAVTVKKPVYFTPSAASRSRLGVYTAFSP